ncbi:MAG: hypothetical protein JWR22_3349 [Herminiimonas sp.]|nr:hypothetical protein [Herminiimonas sp.]
MKTSPLKVAAALGFAVLALNVHAEQASSDKGKGMDMGGMKMDCKGMENMKDMKMDCTGGTPAKASGMSEGVVQAVDSAAKSVTLNHGPIKSKTVEMPGMTMQFPVQNASLLAKVKVGDKVKFNVENVKGTPTVTELQTEK